MEKTEEEIQLLRHNLAQDVFKRYAELVACIKALPLNHQIVGMQNAFSHIDTGMLWVKEILNSSPLVFPEPEAEAIQ